MKHSKDAAKSGTLKYQWSIMEALGIPAEQIAQFANAEYWLEYFPPAAKSDLIKFGLSVDWRRSFITTDKNPFYDSFVKWQFVKLRNQGRVKFGKRYTIYSALDKQPCMDHDRQSGEGVGPQEYTIVKLRVLDPVKGLEGHANVFLAAATLRPETMYGQTSCWVGPDVVYGAFKISEDEIFICTERAAKNLSFQGFSLEEGKVQMIREISGLELLNLRVQAPLSKYGVVHVLPLLTVSANKGTGVVTCVPSDSPDDYAAMRDLREKEPLRNKYGIPAASVLPFEAVPVLHTEAYGDSTAETLCKQLGIRSQNDRVLLDQAKELAYKEGFYKGTMLVGDYKGRPVQEAKALIRKDLIDSKLAIVYYEPEKQVISRSGDECVVSLTDQWYLDYGEDSWRKLAEECLSSMEVEQECRHQFEATLAWLSQWACSRSFGLGSRLPWDEQYLIESLSDSTIYMAYYTVAHILHEGSLDGSVASIKPEEMTFEVWDYILSDGAKPSTSIHAEKLQAMKTEFEYFYPFDLRVSGKDLVPNHLTFSIYNHVALFPKKYWPRSFRANGHLLLNGEKMSKSTGNFMTLSEACDKFSADATRFTLADAGDGLEDANFVEKTANAAILRLFTQLEFFEQALKSREECRTGEFNFDDRVFDSAMNQIIELTREAYEKTMFREALKQGFFELQIARDHYRDVSDKMHYGLLQRFIKVQCQLLAPICPHFSDYVFRFVLNESESIFKAGFAVPGPVDHALLAANAYLHHAIKAFRQTLLSESNPKNKKAQFLTSKPSKATIQVALGYPSWQNQVISILKSSFDLQTRTFRDCNQALLQVKHKKAMAFAVEFKKNAVCDLKLFERELLFDEKKVLEDNLSYLMRSLEIGDVCVELVEGDERIVPLQPSIKYE